MEQIKSCSEEKVNYIHRRLQEYNSRYITDCEDLSYCIENENGECIAGIVASRDMDCITVDYLFVDDAYRKNGYGSELLIHLEEQAIRLHVKRIILNTFGFQAPAFYEKQGYQLFGKIEPCFSDYGQYFFKKEL
ncbi:GNAT family N-acetyltransferase [Tissierella carlieri]|uniref:GNAT family N-acetyltransferase n=1 Tax=Tissierella carlieri TaxID=689904 RepID=A0ABT1S693_9FIRM|nr:GNAT family N-acetyltransferase [Tissierella carlieri]MBU5314034.1 GNAT family N-acetyltransferase [Tissierella carlieri]MCQ4921985.1 GNAT family N-acetyltransferase [Tissierella carlieri]